MKLQTNAQIMYPEHGVAKVLKEEQKRLSGGTQNFFLIEVQRTKAKILIPVDRVADYRIRPVLAATEIKRLLKLPTPKTTAATNWAQAYRENVDKIKTGEFGEVLGVYRQLISKSKGQRTLGEQKILDMTTNLLVEEIQESNQCSPAEAKELLEDHT